MWLGKQQVLIFSWTISFSSRIFSSSSSCDSITFFICATHNTTVSSQIIAFYEVERSCVVPFWTHTGFTLLASLKTVTAWYLPLFPGIASRPSSGDGLEVTATESAYTSKQAKGLWLTNGYEMPNSWWTFSPILFWSKKILWNFCGRWCLFPKSSGKYDQSNLMFCFGNLKGTSDFLISSSSIINSYPLGKHRE